MADQVRISILFPVYNGDQHLRFALDSVVSQLGPNDELVVQDGGSSDDTLNILAEYSSNPAVKIDSRPDSGQSDALGRALARSDGNLIGWLNADDLLLDGALAVVRDEARRQPAAQMIYGNFTVITANGDTIRLLKPRAVTTVSLLANGCFIFSGATFLSRSAIEGAGFNRAFHYCMDFDLFVRISELQSFLAVYVDAPLGAFRYHQLSKSGQVYFGFIREALRVRRDAAKRGNIHVPLLKPTAISILGTFSPRIRYTRAYGRVRGTIHHTGGTFRNRL